MSQHAAREKNKLFMDCFYYNAKYLFQKPQRFRVWKAVFSPKKQKRVDFDAKRSQKPQLKKAFVDTGDVDINALIDRSGIVLD